jgi:hypothetical protein
MISLLIGMFIFECAGSDEARQMNLFSVYSGSIQELPFRKYD